MLFYLFDTYTLWTSYDDDDDDYDDDDDDEISFYYVFACYVKPL